MLWDRKSLQDCIPCHPPIKNPSQWQKPKDGSSFRGTTFVPERMAPGSQSVDAIIPGDLHFREVLRTFSQGSLSVRTSKTTLPVSICYLIRPGPGGLNSFYAMQAVCQEKYGSCPALPLPLPYETKKMKDLHAEENETDRSHERIDIGHKIRKAVKR